MNKAEYNDFVKEVERITLSALTEREVTFAQSKTDIHDIVFDIEHSEIGGIHIRVENWANCKYKSKEPKTLVIYVRCETFSNQDGRVKAVDFNRHSGKCNILASADDTYWILTKYDQLINELFRDHKYNELTLS